MRIDSIVKRGC